jgi:hypothetical protein
METREILLKPGYPMETREILLKADRIVVALERPKTAKPERRQRLGTTRRR